MLHKKDYIGDAKREIELEDIPRAGRLMYLTAVLALVVFGAGKALLYPLSAEELVDVIVKTGLQRFTPTTIVDLPVLQRNLDEARACGYSIDQEEHVTGLNCIASAVYDDVGSVVAAISISGPASRLTPDRFVSQGELVRETARNISTALGLKPQAD